MGKRIDYSVWIGKKLGYLTVLKMESLPRESDGKKTLHLICKCECGNEYNASPYALINGKVKSCGCKAKQRFRKEDHGMSGTRFYNIWQGMLKRCNTKTSNNYENYGGRGIKVSGEWHDFLNFKNDMYSSYKDHVEAYGETDTSIERIDVNGDYTKDNCVWATRKEQIVNNRQVKLYEYKGEKLDLTEISRRENINYRTLRARLFQYGWTLEEALERSHLKWSKKKAELYDYKGELITLKEIAKRENMSYSTLHNRIKIQKVSLDKALERRS